MPAFSDYGQQFEPEGEYGLEDHWALRGRGASTFLEAALPGEDIGEDYFDLQQNPVDTEGASLPLSETSLGESQGLSGASSMPPAQGPQPPSEAELQEYLEMFLTQKAARRFEASEVFQNKARVMNASVFGG